MKQYLNGVSSYKVMPGGAVFKPDRRRPGDRLCNRWAENKQENRRFVLLLFSSMCLTSYFLYLLI